MNSENLECFVCGNNEPGKFKIYYDFEQKLFKCLSCTFIFRVSAKNIDYHLFEEYYKPEDEEKFNSRYFKFIINTIKQYLPYNIRQYCILDIGAGNCRFLRTAQQEGFKNIVGVDPLPNSAIIAKRFSIPLVSAYYTRTLFKEESFDCIYSSHLLEHIRQPLEFISDTYFHLKKGGILCIYIPSMHSVGSILYELTKKRFFIKHIINPQHFSYFNPQSLTTLLTRTGYNIIDMRTGDWFYKRDSLFRYFFKLSDPILNFFKLESITVFAKK